MSEKADTHAKATWAVGRGGMRRGFRCALVLMCVSQSFASRKILLLHGSTSSAGAFMARGAANVLGAASAAYHDGGPHAWTFGGLDWDVDIAEVTDGGWWTDEKECSAESKAAVDKAVSVVEKAVCDGGYNGILGFEHGALLASVVAARAELGDSEDACSNLQFAVFCSAGIAEPFADVLERLADTPPSLRRLRLPTLHCLSEADTVMPPDQGALLAACFGGDVLWHEAGHDLPPKDDCKDLIAWCDEVCPEGSKFAN